VTAIRLTAARVSPLNHRLASPDLRRQRPDAPSRRGGFRGHLAIFVTPLGNNAYGPGVPLGWPPRFLLLSYMVWLITLAWQAIQLRTRHT
jgi:hypothetical protein